MYVDYLRQFSGEKAPRAARGTGSARNTEGAPAGDIGGAGDGGAGAPRQGHWVTVGGAKVRL